MALIFKQNAEFHLVHSSLIESCSDVTNMLLQLSVHSKPGSQFQSSLAAVTNSQLSFILWHTSSFNEIWEELLFEMQGKSHEGEGTLGLDQRSGSLHLVLRMSYCSLWFQPLDFIKSGLLFLSWIKWERGLNGLKWEQQVKYWLALNEKKTANYTIKDKTCCWIHKFTVAGA